MAAKRRLPVSAREAALQALVRVETEGAYLNLVLPKLLAGLPPPEEALTRRLAAGVLERRNTLDWALSLFASRPLDALTPWIRNLLRLGAYQLLYLDRVPVYAAVAETVKLARRYGHPGVAGLVNAILRRLDGERENLPWPDRETDPLSFLALRYSQPRWLAARAQQRLGLAGAEQWGRAGLEKPPLALRPNLLRLSSERLATSLAEEGIYTHPSPFVPGLLRFSSGPRPASSQAFRAGLFTIQGESSALAAPLLQPKPGEILVDLCSAPGGKTTHLAELQKDSGLIWAVEPLPSRLRLVERAASRLGLNSIRTLLADGTAAANLGLPAPDAVLVDAPCSGLGVTARLPEIKWRRREEDLATNQDLQVELLCAAATILAPGGRLLYAVCSTEPEETGQVVSAFNRRYPGYAPRSLHMPRGCSGLPTGSPTITIEPAPGGLDGFFYAAWTKQSRP